MYKYEHWVNRPVHMVFNVSDPYFVMVNFWRFQIKWNFMKSETLLKKGSDIQVWLIIHIYIYTCICVSHDILHTIIGRRKPVYIFLFDVKFTTFEIMEITLAGFEWGSEIKSCNNFLSIAKQGNSYGFEWGSEIKSCNYFLRIAKQENSYCFHPLVTLNNSTQYIHVHDC